MHDNIDATDSGALEANHHDAHTLEYQTPTFQSMPLGDMVEDASEIVEGARTLEGYEMRVGWEREQAIEHGVDKRPTESVDPDRQDMTTEVIERINGEQEELKHQYETAHRAETAEHDRAQACREEVTSDTYYQETTLDETPEVEGQSESPWTELSQDEVASVNQGAKQLADRFEHETAMGSASMGKLLAQRVTEGQNPASAALNLKDSIEQLPEVKQPIASIDPFNQYATTIEGTIDVLWSPRGAGQRQVGLISDESNESIKITVWQKAGQKPTLHEGDKVRVERGKVNAYQRSGKWETSIAIDSEARIIHLEQGDGPAPRQKRMSDEPRQAPWDVDSRAHSWANQHEMGSTNE
ncbi:hypothetical protein [Haloarcula sp. K1]|uniref:hypothetical protein n=1 Tax=Haloarcula sp. K1 TaxID=1622207 RepID=UPI0007BC7E5B|nr:hypothetical protein [Haloarcula sp. K1]KZX46230.1 hypothetical protein AV929_15770 [Haloarcula sp. K1]